MILGGLKRRCAELALRLLGQPRPSSVLIIRPRTFYLGMAKYSAAVAELLKRAFRAEDQGWRGCVWLGERGDAIPFDTVGLYSFYELRSDKKLLAKAYGEAYRQNDHVTGKAFVEYYGDRMLVVNPPMPPLERDELDHVYSLPYCRTYHPMYESEAASRIEEFRFLYAHRGASGLQFLRIASSGVRGSRASSRRQGG